jgi:hypothetical protein
MIEGLRGWEGGLPKTPPPENSKTEPIYLSLNGKAPASKERYSIRWDKWFHPNLVVLRVFTL